MQARRAQQTAFTLLEMLVALTLMGLLATGLYASLWTGLRAQRSVQAALKPVRAAGLALQFVSHGLGSALPPTGVLAGPFVGQDATDSGTGKETDTMTWFAAAGQPTQGASDVVELTLAITSVENTGERVLALGQIRNLLAPTEQEPTQEILCRGVVSLNLRYFDGSDWVDEWESTAYDDTLPAAVEVSLAIEREAKGQTEASPHRLTRVFVLPCFHMPSDTGIQMPRAGGR